MTQLELTQISQSYREAGRRLLALRDINLAVAAGEFVTIIGPSGCGKSTLLEIIAGLQQPDSGSVRFDGHIANNRLGRTAYMPQLDALLPWRTVLNNVVIGPEVGRGSRHKAKQQARELLPLFGLEGFSHAFPSQLSGGMRQRAALLRTFLVGKAILLLDEPFGALDAITRHELQAWLLQVWQHFGYTIVFVTHDVEEAIYLSDRVVVLSHRPGQVVMEMQVPFARPRDSVRYSLEMTALETQLYQALRQPSG